MIRKMRKELQRKGARRGFTLVELLIVIIIIGILAGAMMLVAGTSRDAAEASKIISDLRNVKAAALMWLAENPNVTAYSWDGTLPTGVTEPSPVDLTTPLKNDPTPLNKYLDKPLITGHHYLFEAGEATVGEDDEGTTDIDESKATVWFLGYDLAAANVRTGVRTNLAKQAKSVGLYGSTEIDLTNDTDPGYYTGGDKVYVMVQ